MILVLEIGISSQFGVSLLCKLFISITIIHGGCGEDWNILELNAQPVNVFFPFRRILIPVLAAVFIIWWAVGLLANNPEWNSLGPTSFFTVMLEVSTFDSSQTNQHWKLP